MKRIISTAILGAALAAGPALAAENGWAEVPDNAKVPGFDMTADQFDEFDIVDAAGNKIGEIEDVLAKGGGEASAVGVEFKQFSDYSPGKDIDVVVPLAKLSLKDNKLTLNASANDVKAMQTYPDD